jgi:hypothetical protein
MVRISKYFCEPNKGMQLRSGKRINCIENTDFYKEHFYYILMSKYNYDVCDFSRCEICTAVNRSYYFLLDCFVFIKNEPQLAWYYYSIKRKKNQQNLYSHIHDSNDDLCYNCYKRPAKVKTIKTYLEQYTNEPHLIHKNIYFHLLHKLNIISCNLIFEYL